ncbi:fimbrial protein [Acinetobacter guillouiae]|uniref:fimbrial protein n=1 Tax=Acinetobacter guillouiae TaxID=106649 RepID=UPI003AF7EE0E
MQKLTLATLSTLALTLACTNVFALDGTLTVNGVVTDQTCTLQASGSGGGFSTGLKDITVTLPTGPKSKFTPAVPPIAVGMSLFLKNASGTAPCDAATTKAFKGIHLSASPDHLDATDKTLLVNQASGASAKNPVFILFLTDGFDIVGAGVDGSKPVDFSAPWGRQAKSSIRNSAGGNISVLYLVSVYSKTGIVDAQNYTAKVNYTIHYN